MFGLCCQCKKFIPHLKKFTRFEKGAEQDKLPVSEASWLIAERMPASLAVASDRPGRLELSARCRRLPEESSKSSPMGRLFFVSANRSVLISDITEPSSRIGEPAPPVDIRVRRRSEPALPAYDPDRPHWAFFPGISSGRIRPTPIRSPVGYFSCKVCAFTYTHKV